MNKLYGPYTRKDTTVLQYVMVDENGNKKTYTSLTIPLTEEEIEQALEYTKKCSEDLKAKRLADKQAKLEAARKQPKRSPVTPDNCSQCSKPLSLTTKGDLCKTCLDAKKKALSGVLPSPEQIRQRILSNAFECDNGCIEYRQPGAVKNHYYSKVKINNISKDVHRWIMIAKENRLLESHELVCHSCDNKLCVNVDHLFLGTAKDNVVDAIQKGIIIPPKPNSPTFRSYSIEMLYEARELQSKGLTHKQIAKLLDIPSENAVRNFLWRNKGVK